MQLCIWGVSVKNISKHLWCCAPESVCCCFCYSHFYCFLQKLLIFCYKRKNFASNIMDHWKIAVVAILAIYYCTQVSFVSGLECYVCSNQTGNVEKCLNTIKTCEPGEDVCGTEIRWGSQPYFSLGAIKQYYVSKRCMTKQQCQAKRKRHMPYCTHIWYEDWSCHECCQGDRCNYFVISGSAKMHNSFGAIVAAIAASLVFIIKRQFY